MMYGHGADKPRMRERRLPEPRRRRRPRRQHRRRRSPGSSAVSKNRSQVEGGDRELVERGRARARRRASLRRRRPAASRGSGRMVYDPERVRRAARRGPVTTGDPAAHVDRRVRRAGRRCPRGSTPDSRRNARRSAAIVPEGGGLTFAGIPGSRNGRATPVTTPWNTPLDDRGRRRPRPTLPSVRAGRRSATPHCTRMPSRRSSCSCRPDGTRSPDSISTGAGSVMPAPTTSTNGASPIPRSAVGSRDWRQARTRARVR